MNTFSHPLSFVRKHLFTDFPIGIPYFRTVRLTAFTDLPVAILQLRRLPVIFNNDYGIFGNIYIIYIIIIPLPSARN